MELLIKFGQSLFKSQVGTIVKFYCRVFDRDRNCNIQESLRCKFFEKISGLISSLIQIPDSFLHLFLTSVNASRELSRVIWSFRSHLDQFLNYKLTWDVPSRPDLTWASVLPVQKSWLASEKPLTFFWVAAKVFLFSRFTTHIF